ncbi:MAG: hypothetical protein AAFZ65_12750 [Planctomycetota bacterium]
MWTRVQALFQAELAALTGVASLVGTAAAHGLIAALLGGIVRSELTAFGFACYAYAVACGLLALPLVGEVGTWLRTRHAEEWIDSLPARRGEVAGARLGVALVALWSLSLGSLLPLSLIAPDLDWGGRAAFFGLGLAATTSAASVLIFAQGLLARRPTALVAIQTLITIAVAGGLLLGLPAALSLAEVATPADLEAMGGSKLPTAIFAAPLVEGLGRLDLPLYLLGAALGAAWAGLVRQRSHGDVHGGSTPLDRLFAPLRRGATALWVRGDERAGFDLVYDAMPRERETALRTYPLLAVPLLFAFVVHSTSDSEQREAFTALLLFTPGFYLPVLLAHVPASSSWRARWLVDTAPADRACLTRGAFKAVATRYVLPLHVALGLLAWQQVGLGTALRLAVPATFVSIAVLRPLYRATVEDLPLSIPPEEAGDPNALTGPLMAAGIGLAIVALVANAVLASPLHGVLAGVAMAGLELHRARRGPSVSSPAAAPIRP